MAILLNNHPNSSMIHSSSYDPKTSKMTVTFRDRSRGAGVTYEATGVPQEHFDAMNSAPSAGQYYHKNLKNNYSFTKSSGSPGTMEC